MAIMREEFPHAQVAMVLPVTVMDPAGFPMLAGQHAEYLAHSLRQFSIGARHNDGEGKVMRNIAERMNENEIKAVASYIAGLRP